MYIINCPYDYFSLLVALELSCPAGEHRVRAGLPKYLDLVIFLKKKSNKKKINRKKKSRTVSVFLLQHQQINTQNTEAPKLDHLVSNS